MQLAPRREAAAVDVHLRRAAVGTLAVVKLSATFPPPEALTAPVSGELLVQAYAPPPAYPPTEPPPVAYAPRRLRHIAPSPFSDLQSMADARANVRQQISGTLWFFAGFFLTWVGILLRYSLEPTLDRTRLIGKPPAHVVTYTATYKSEGKLPGHPRGIRCVTSGAIYLVAIVVVILELVLVGAAAAGAGA